MSDFDESPKEWLDRHERPLRPKKPCYKCRYFDPFYEGDYGHRGICTRFPPVPAPMGGDLPEFFQPDVGVYGTCGEWEAVKRRSLRC